MTPAALLGLIAVYFGALLWVARRTGAGATNEGFFVGNRTSHWAVVAFGMIGTSLSGVTFISVPGSVGSTQWHYLQIVLGQLLGYAAVALVLLPLYYRLHVSSIYRYLAWRLGTASGRTGAGFFILSRTLGATARLYLVVRILQDTILDAWHVPFWLTSLVLVALIVVYTLEGGVKTLVWTDLLQTCGMLAGLVACSAFVLHALQLTPLQAWQQMQARGLVDVFCSDVDSADHWLKQIVAGVVIALTMTGMDQEMMQKNISVRTLAGAQRNVLTMAALMLLVVVLFLHLGALLQLFASAHGMSEHGDRLFPAVVMQHFGAALQAVFFVALISALFPSADGALTALTSSFCIDVLGLPQRAGVDERRAQAIRRRVHLAFAAAFAACLLGFRWLDDPLMLTLILKIAGYTYGPLLGLFAFGILTRRTVNDRAVPWIALAAPLACALLDHGQAVLFGSYRIGLELLLVNGALCFAGLWAVSGPGEARHTASKVVR